MSDKLRITGMASGLDVDNTVKQMMKPYQTKLDKMKQDRQIVQWQQDLYRDIIGDLTTFRSTYYDVLKSDTYMLTPNNYAGFDVSSVSSLGSSTAANVTATAVGPGVTEGNYTVKVDNLANAATIVGSKLASGTTIDSKMSELGMTSDTTFNITFNGTTKAVTIKTSDTINNVISNINNVTSGSVTAKFSELTGRFQLMTTESGASKSLKIDQNIAALGLSNGIQGNSLVGTIDPNSYVVGGDTPFDITLTDGTSTSTITVASGETIKTLTDKINSTGSFTGNFDTTTGRFSIVSNDSTKQVSIDKDIAALKIKAGAGTVGQDASLTITPPGGNPVQITKSSNTFSIDGINYNLITTGTSNLSVTASTTKVFDKIKGFIDKYNELVDKINKKVEEKKQYSYKPLTDDQKKGMSDDDIKAWESKAKEGLLKNDSALNGLLDTMRSAFFQGVEGAGITLSDLGLSTSSDTTQRGKIIFDASLGGEQKLKDAIKTKGQQVANLFMKTTSTNYKSYSPDLTASQRSDRTSDEGIFQRINDIMLDYVRTSRDKAGKKGTLIEKAGIKGDFTEYSNILYNQLTDQDKMINDFAAKLSDKEEKYYQQFSKLEQAMNNLNSQSSWLAQQLGTSK